MQKCADEQRENPLILEDVFVVDKIILKLSSMIYNALHVILLFHIVVVMLNFVQSSERKKISLTDTILCFWRGLDVNYTFKNLLLLQIAFVNNIVRLTVLCLVFPFKYKVNIYSYDYSMKNHNYYYLPRNMNISLYVSFSIRIGQKLQKIGQRKYLIILRYSTAGMCCLL